MSCCSKEKMERNDYNNTCKSHSVKSDREMYRVCPSKLSKRELEDLYFTLLENNLELKKTINGQQDKIRLLSTQVQRMTKTQDKMMSKEIKDCSTCTKSFVNEQKDFIKELKETNRRMAVRIQQLNMRLCSAKQFSKTTPQQSNSRCFRFATASPPKKHDCLTKDQDKEVLKLSTSSQWENRNPRQSTQTQTTVPFEKRSPKTDQPCDENKCRSLMEELKVKIVTLKEELFNVHDEYSTRIGHLEAEVSEVRKENIRVCSERSASEHELQNTAKRTSDILAQYRLSEAKCSELATELAIEKRKIAELETRLKASNISDKVNKTIEDHLTTKQETSGAQDDCILKCNCGCPPAHLPPCVMDKKAAIKTLLLLSAPKRRDSEDRSTKTKYSPSKDSSSISQQVSKSSPIKTISEETNCETCGCKAQLTSDPVPVHSRTPGDTLPLLFPPKRRDSEDHSTKTKYIPKKDSSITSQQVRMSSPIKTISETMPLLSPPKRRDSEDHATKTKYIPDKDSSISTSQQVSKSSPIKTISEVANCETCGCKAQLTSDPVPVHSPTPGDTMPLLSAPKRRNSEDYSTKTKYSPSKDSSSTKQQVSKSDPTKTISEETNCETCGCKSQLMSDPVHIPPPTEDCKCRECECRPPQDLSTQAKNIQCDLCDCGSPENTSTPLKAKKSIECCCPGWVKVGILKSPPAQTQDVQPECMKCCFKDTHEATESPPSKNDKFLSPRGGTSRWSPSQDKDGTKSSKTGDDSGYQDTDEAVLLNQNKELMTKILVLQNQVESMKIQMSEMSEAKPNKISESTGNPKNTGDYAIATAAAPLLSALKKEKISAEQIDYNKSMEGGNYKSTKQVPVTVMVSEERVCEPGKILSVEILNNPKESVRTRNWDDTRAKTIEHPDGTLLITEGASSETLSPLDLMNVDYRENYKIDSRKLKIMEKKKLDTPGSSKQESANVSLKSVMSNISGPILNAEKLKYLKAEGVITESVEDSLSLTESVPSNPELGFGIPMLASRSTDKYKAKVDSAQAKKSPAASSPSTHQSRDDRMEVLHDKLKLSTTKGLVANNPTAPKQTDETKKKKEDCENCAACSFDKECELKHENATNHRINKLAPKMHDQHNSLQIPGPIPTTDSKREKVRNLFSQFTKDRSSKQNKEDIVINPKIDGQQTTATTDKPTNLADEPLLDKKESSKHDVKKLSSRIVFSIDNDLDPPLLEVKFPNNCPNSDRMLPTLRGKTTHVERKADVAQNTDQKFAEKSSQAPTHIADTACHQRKVSLYRRRSGTICHRTVPVSPDPPVCHCVGQQDGYCTDKPRKKGNHEHDKEEMKFPRDQSRLILTSERGTYTVNSKQTDTSPANTDLEMSYLSDLPMEKEKKITFKSRSLSPGEDKTTTFTNTHSYYSPPNSLLLSEGELPTTTQPKHSEPDTGRPSITAAQTHTQQMEAALNAISEELHRCRTMINTHRPAERTQCASQTSSSEITPPIALRPGVATQGIGDTYAPISVFTLHIGTVVWSDKAVINSHNKNLVLKWKFYDQALTMARMHAGRVAVFDFSTDYGIKVTDEFLHYLKYKEMPIIICVLGQEKEPFASCLLPLRDALLHTNTRVDMSLALVAGPQMLKESAKNVKADTFDTGDEIGVIDLWCLMRADANMVSGINLAIAQPAAAPMMAEQRHANVMPQVLDDYNDLDLSMGKPEPGPPLDPTGRNQTYGNVGYIRTSNTWSNSDWQIGPTKEKKRDSETTETSTYDPSKYPPIRGRKLTAPVASSTVQLTKRDDAAQERRHQSELIMNEVNPKIKAPGDIRHAVERSKRIMESRPRLHRSDDTFSLAQSSYGSLRSVLSRLQKRGSRITQTQGGDQRSFIKKLRKASRTSDAAPRIPDKTKASAMEQYMEYENISKRKAANKAEQSKKVTILPKHVNMENEESIGDSEEPTEDENQTRNTPKLEITVLWLALNEECEAMINPYVQRVYVAYTFLGRSGAELETPVSLPKPKHYVDKCYFNFSKVFELSSSDLLKLGHMARCRSGSPVIKNEKDCIIFSVVTEPADDPLGLESCEDIGYACLYLGDLLEYSSGSPSYTEVIPVRAAHGPDYVCGVLAVHFDGLDVVHRCMLLTPEDIPGHST